jgi:hypothetical protein
MPRRPLPPRLIRIRPLAELLGVPAPTLRAAILRGGVPVHRVSHVAGELGKGAAMYLTVGDAARVAAELLGARADVALRARLQRQAMRQKDAFGAFRTEVAPWTQQPAASAKVGGTGM